MIYYLRTVAMSLTFSLILHLSCGEMTRRDRKYGKVWNIAKIWLPRCLLVVVEHIRYDDKFSCLSSYFISLLLPDSCHDAVVVL